MDKQKFFQRHPRFIVALAVFFGTFTLIRGGMDLWNYITRPGEAHDVIMADSCPVRQTLTLPVKGWYDGGQYPAYGGVSFTYSSTFAELKANITEICGAENVEDYPSKSQLLIRQIDSDGAYHYYLLEHPIISDQYAVFYGMRAKIVMTSGVSRTDSPDILLPFHLIDDDRISGTIDPILYAGAEYQLNVAESTKGAWEEDISALMQKQFLDFYSTTAYEVQIDGDDLILSYGEEIWTISFCTHAGRAFFSMM